MDAVIPGVSERSDHLGLTAQALGLPVFDFTTFRGRLPIGVEPNPIGRVHVNALDLTLERFLLGEAGHHQ